MAETQITEQIVKENPQIEAYRLSLLQAAQGLTKNPVNIPAYQVAGLSPFETQAMQLAQQGLGSYQPYLTTGTEALGGGAQAYSNISPIASQIAQTGMGTMQGINPFIAGMSGVSQTVNQQVNPLGAASVGVGMGGMGEMDPYQRGLNALSGQSVSQVPGMYDTGITQQFMNPYQQAVTDQTLADIRRQAQIDMNSLRARNVASGSYGGTRAAISEQEFQRNVTDTMARTLANDRSQNYMQAQQAGMSAFEADRQRRLAAYQQGMSGLQASAGLGLQGRNMALQGLNQGINTSLQAGQLGLGALQSGAASYLDAQRTGLGALQTSGQLYGSLGDAYSNLGVQYGNMGALGTQLGQEQSRYLAMLGGVQRENAQAGLEAARNTELARIYEPYNRLGFLSDVYAKTPTSQSTITQSTAPSASPVASALGSGIQAYAMYQGMNNLWNK